MSRSSPLCRHCQRHRVNRPRGLCWSCYYLPSVRDLYPSTSKYTRCGVLDRNGNTPQPSESTKEPAGSLEKVVVLEGRAARGESLWHPDDSVDVVNRGKMKLGHHRGEEY